MKARAALLALVLVLSFSAPLNAAPQYRYTLSYTFENRGTTDITLDESDLSAPKFLDTEWQIVKATSFTPRSRGEDTDDDGNPFYVMDISSNLKAGSSVTFTVVYEVETTKRAVPKLSPSTAEGLGSIPRRALADYGVETSTYPIADAAISAKAMELAGSEKTVLGRVTRILGWFTDNLRYESNEVPRRANETFATLTGDCDDQTILLVTMLRSVGVPAYMEIGVIFNSGIKGSDTSWSRHLTNEQDGVGWHGWAMVYVPPYGWIPVDLTYASGKDPIQKMQNAPEYGGSIAAVMKVDKQDYVGDTLATRERLTKSSLYVKTSDVAAQITTPFWVNPTLIGLAVALAVAIGLMFATSRPGGLRWPPKL